MGLYLKINASTWLRDSHDLFDYDSTYLAHSKLRIQGSCCLVRNGNEILQAAEPVSPCDGVILKITEKAGEFIVTPAKDSHAGIIIKDLKLCTREGFKLSVGDMLKLGKVMMMVKQSNQSPIDVAIEDEDSEESSTTDVACRICFRTHNFRVNPLLSLCSCAGSMAFTHFRCLQRWFISKAIKKITPHTISYCWKALECDICKKPMPLKFNFNDLDHELINLPRPMSPFLVLEDFRKEKFKLILHLVTPDIAPLILGRSNECDLKINDISVSRSHATLSIVDGDFYLKDNFSKFGTLVFMPRPVAVGLKSPISIQVNKTVLRIKARQVETMKDCLCCCKNYSQVEPVPRRNTQIPWEEISLQSPYGQL